MAAEQSNRQIEKAPEVPVGFLARARKGIEGVLRRAGRPLLPYVAVAAVSVGATACEDEENKSDTFSQIQESTGGITSAGPTDGGSGSEGESETDGGMDSDSDSEGGTGGEDPTGTTGDVDTTTGGVTSEGSTSGGMDTTAGPEDPCEALNCGPDEMCAEVDGEVVCEAVDNEPPIAPKILTGGGNDILALSNKVEIELQVDINDTEETLFSLYKSGDPEAEPIDPILIKSQKSDVITTEVLLPGCGADEYWVAFVSMDAKGNKSKVSKGKIIAAC